MTKSNWCSSEPGTPQELLVQPPNRECCTYGVQRVNGEARALNHQNPGSVTLVGA